MSVCVYMCVCFVCAQVIAYTMKEYKMSLQDALTHVKSKRPIVNPNDGFMNQLLAYEGILRARYLCSCVHVLVTAVWRLVCVEYWM